MTVTRPQAQFDCNGRGCLLPISLPASEPDADADADAGSEIQKPELSALDQVLALMQVLGAEDLAKVQGAAADRITALALDAVAAEMRKAG